MEIIGWLGGCESRCAEGVVGEEDAGEGVGDDV